MNVLKVLPLLENFQFISTSSDTITNSNLTKYISEENLLFSGGSRERLSSSAVLLF